MRSWLHVLLTSWIWRVRWTSVNRQFLGVCLCVDIKRVVQTWSVFPRGGFVSCACSTHQDRFAGIYAVIWVGVKNIWGSQLRKLHTTRERRKRAILRIWRPNSGVLVPSSDTFKRSTAWRDVIVWRCHRNHGLETIFTVTRKVKDSPICSILVLFGTVLAHVDFIIFGKKLHRRARQNVTFSTNLHAWATAQKLSVDIWGAGFLVSNCLRPVGGGPSRDPGGNHTGLSVNVGGVKLLHAAPGTAVCTKAIHLCAVSTAARLIACCAIALF